MGQDETVIIAFARLPVPGQVKTRLAAGVGKQAACDFYAACAAHALHVCHSCGVGRLVVYHSSADATRDVDAWLQELGLQVEGDLGAKLREALTSQLSQPGVSKVLVVGTDIPDLSGPTLAAAAAALDHYELVLGPAVDGGYYLMGLTRMEPSLFQGIAWSTSEVLAQTCDHAARAGMRTAPMDALPQLQDVDTIEDVRAWHSTFLAASSRSGRQQGILNASNTVIHTGAVGSGHRGHAGGQEEERPVGLAQAKAGTDGTGLSPWHDRLLGVMHGILQQDVRSV